MHLKLPTVKGLKYRRLRGDMIKVFKITHGIIYTIQKYHPSSCIIQNLTLKAISTNNLVTRLTMIHENTGMT